MGSQALSLPTSHPSTPPRPAPNVAALMQSDVVFDQPPEQLLETMVPLFLDSQMARPACPPTRRTLVPGCLRCAASAEPVQTWFSH